MMYPLRHRSFCRIVFARHLECLAMLLALLVATNARAASGTIDFDADPGFLIEDKPCPWGECNDVVVNIRTEDSVMDLTMSRDGAAERVTLPIDTIPGPTNNLKLRTRFAVQSEEGGGVDINVGFYNLNDCCVTNTQTTAAIIEGINRVNYPGHLFGGRFDRLRPGLTIEFLTWYVYEFEFQADQDNPITALTLFEGDGVTVLESEGIVAEYFEHAINNEGALGLWNNYNAVGFGNEDQSHAPDLMTAVIDWVTWSVDEPLPPDPPYAAHSAAAPIPPESSPCDFNDDGFCNLDDLNATDGLYSVGNLVEGVAVPPADAKFDLTGDNTVNGADLDEWLAQAAARAGKTGPFLKGDTDLNGTVAFNDFVKISNNFNPGCPIWIPTLRHAICAKPLKTRDFTQFMPS